jgi:Ca2+-binding RTX toxin-like protein
LTSYDGDDTLVGGSGDDVMKGGAGNDTYFLDSAGDVAVEKSFSADDGGIDLVHMTGFSYTLAELFENLTLHGGDLDGTGNALANVIIGTGGINLLKGGDGNDRLVGNKGVDTLFGEAGADTFVFKSITDSGLVVGTRDKVMDFVSGVDVIDLSGIDANSLLDGDQAFTLDTDGTLAIGEYSIKLTQAGNTLIALNVDSGSAPDMQIQLNGVASLQMADLML